MSTYNIDEKREIMRAIGSQDTEPEKEMTAALDNLGIAYDTQVKIGRYQADFLLEDGSVLQIMYDTETHQRRRELLNDYNVSYVFWIWEDAAERVYDYCISRGIA